MKVAIYGQPYQENAMDYVGELLDELGRFSASVAIEQEFFAHLRLGGQMANYSTFTHSNGLDSTFDLLVSFGGDGTILRATTFVRDLGIPIVGVNTGRLGFLSTFKKEEVR
ncbi:MAG: NAD(+)/NADH kinase [Flavobacteriaceae bacterium]